jgi:hypothetical protein
VPGATLAAGSVPSAGLDDAARLRVVNLLVGLAAAPVVLGGDNDSPALRFAQQAEGALRGALLLGAVCGVALADYSTATARDAVLSAAVKGFDALLPIFSDTVFEAALDCRAALVDALLAQALAPATVRGVVNNLPATVLAHRLQVTEEVFIATNQVRHPLFVRGVVYG